MKTSVIVKFRASSIEGKKGVIYYQVTHNRVIRQIKSEYKIHTHEWDAKENVVVTHYAESDRAKELRLIRDKVALDQRRLYKVATELTGQAALNHCGDLVFAYRSLPKIQTFFDYLKAQISNLEECGKLGTASNYMATFNSFYKFRDGEDLIFDNLTGELMGSYESYLKREAVLMNSISFYMRNLRAVYNKAVAQGLVDQQNPFTRVYTGIDATLKGVLTLEEIKRIKEYNQISNSTCEYARDMFLFSFYTCGMSFVDIANLRNSDIADGVLSYQKRKRGATLYIKWEQCMQDIVDKYHVGESQYLFPIINDIANKPNEHNRYKNELYKVNNWLKRLSGEMHLKITLTMNVARHSWALAAKAKNIPLPIISESLGYNNMTTTQLYLASLDSSITHGANGVILDDLGI